MFTKKIKDEFDRYMSRKKIEMIWKLTNIKCECIGTRNSPNNCLTSFLIKHIANELLQPTIKQVL